MKSFINRGILTQDDVNFDALVQFIPQEIRDDALRLAAILLHKLLWPTKVEDAARDRSSSAEQAINTPPMFAIENSAGSDPDLVREIDARSSISITSALKASEDFQSRIATIAGKYLHARRLSLSNDKTMAKSTLQEVMGEADSLGLHTIRARASLELSDLHADAHDHYNARKAIDTCDEACKRGDVLLGGMRANVRRAKLAELMGDLNKAVKLLNTSSDDYGRLLTRCVELRGRLESTLQGSPELIPDVAPQILYPSLFPSRDQIKQRDGRILFQQLLWPVNVETIKREAEYCLRYLCVLGEQTRNFALAAKAWKRLAAQNKIFESGSDGTVILYCLRAARLYRLANRPALSKECLSSAKRRLKESPDLSLLSRMYEEMALLEQSQENLRRALSLFREAIRHCQGDQSQGRRFIALLYHKANLELRMDYFSASRTTFKRVVDESKHSDDPTISKIRQSVKNALLTLSEERDHGKSR